MKEFHIRHEWADLGDLSFELTQSILGTKVKSVFQIVAICDRKGCKAGKSIDGRVFKDVESGQRLRGEVVTTTGRLGRR